MVTRDTLWQPGQLVAGGTYMPAACLPSGWCGYVDARGVHTVAEQMQQSLSSAPLLGGVSQAEAWFNHCVDPDEPLDMLAPDVLLDRAAAMRGLPARVLGMMTAASMASLRVASAPLAGDRTSVMVTCDTDNAARVGEPATAGAEPGTVNMVVLLPVGLNEAARVDCVVTLTEAKTIAFVDSDVAGARRRRQASGTETDAVGVFCPQVGPRLVAAGKHTEIGETVGRLAVTALKSAIAGNRRASAHG
ncbi:adenosylcobinamide amidohydrolase [Salinisphaera sp. Q1T1-3]|uniref:adenosylcobinamide amidohydrolase n=1 Tax=Salinisphaera sp. Q1T1-3 TaxID=2321229 RepID=UPI001314680B|nr:adenosylcobinamide amidohydrolase [Salinisphaera sp. Q1T1-3]